MSTPNPAAKRGLSLPFAGKGSPLGRKGRRSDFIQESGRFGEGFWGPNTHFRQETTLSRYKRFVWFGVAVPRPWPQRCWWTRGGPTAPQKVQGEGLRRGSPAGRCCPPCPAAPGRGTGVCPGTASSPSGGRASWLAIALRMWKCESSSCLSPAEGASSLGHSLYT